MIYLDSAATTLQKPRSVSEAMVRAMERCASPGRGGHSGARSADELLYRCREYAARLFDVPSPEQVVLTFNATHGLNIAIRTLVKPGCTVVISGYEHNAVTRVLHSIPNITVRIASAPPFDTDGVIESFCRELSEGADVVICNHVSNVFGFIQPVARIAELCKKLGIPLIVDASQSAGVLPVSLGGWDAAFIAMPGHKGLYGPQGTGLLLCAEDTEPLLFGGTGSSSKLQSMPDFLPDRLEAGTYNVCGAAGLLAGIEFVNEVGIHNIMYHERLLRQQMMEQLRKAAGINLYEGRDQCGVFSFIPAGQDCQEFGGALAECGIAVRAGLHCAPLAHTTAGTLGSGTVRVSFSAFNQMDEIDRASDVICTLAEERRGQ